jgi:hypothetical protein
MDEDEPSFRPFVQRWWQEKVRMSKETFYALLELIQDHESMRSKGLEEGGLNDRNHKPHRMLAAWLYWVGPAARFSEVDDFSGIASGSLGAQGPRKEAQGLHGVLWRVTTALHDVLFTGEGHELNNQEGEVQWPKNPDEVMNKVAEWWQRSSLPGVVGAVDGTLIACPAPKKAQRLVQYGPFGEGLLESLRAWYCYKKKCVAYDHKIIMPHRHTSHSVITLWCYNMVPPLRVLHLYNALVHRYFLHSSGYRYAWLLLACVDANGRFTWIKNGIPGSTGDAASFNSSDLDSHLRCHLHQMYPVTVLKDAEGGTVNIQPYVLADSAFRLSRHTQKCYDPPFADVGAAIEYNKAVTSTRRCEPAPSQR